MNEPTRKLEKLRGILQKTGGIAIAFSGGVDSTFLAAVAVQELGERAVAVTALSPTYSAREQQQASELAASLGIKHVTVESNELEIPNFSDNPPDRCYYCKAELFSILREKARELGIDFVADGTNADDLDDYRPGRRASKEHGVMAPLLEAGLTKDDIRQLSRQMGLSTADKPALACLASRFPYGSSITAEKLAAVDSIENGLRDLGFVQLRVRHHGEIARIEVGPDELDRLLDPATRGKVVELGKKAGFHYVSMDLEGYRTGSMNETLGVAEVRDQRPAISR